MQINSITKNLSQKSMRQLKGRMLQIAEGSSGLPEATAEKYRLTFVEQGYELPEFVFTGEFRSSPPTTQPDVSTIGTCLYAVIARKTGLKIGCCACNREIQRLNKMTPEQVRAERLTIALAIVVRSANLSLKFRERTAVKIAPSIVARWVIAPWIDTAIDDSLSPHSASGVAQIRLP